MFPNVFPDEVFASLKAAIMMRNNAGKGIIRSRCMAFDENSM
jgi:hypothetical protein